MESIDGRAHPRAEQRVDLGAVPRRFRTDAANVHHPISKQREGSDVRSRRLRTSSAQAMRAMQSSPTVLRPASTSYKWLRAQPARAASSERPTPRPAATNSTFLAKQRRASIFVSNRVCGVTGSYAGQDEFLTAYTRNPRSSAVSRTRASMPCAQGRRRACSVECAPQT